MAKLNSLKTDKGLEATGIWVTWVLDVEVLVARLSNANFTAFYRKQTKPYTRGGGEVPEKALMDIMREGFAKYVLLDWRNLQDDDGDEIVYSPEKAMEFFEDEEMQDFFTFILRIAKDEDFYRKADEEEAEGN